MAKKRSVKLFAFFAFSTLFGFVAILIGSTVVAYSRVSGATGLSMMKVQEIRANKIASGSVHE